ncbi:MAG: MFS transporter [Actinobacteria bacterium]|nr:MFS transporter [Actinomycetota bacterium]MCB9412477.1 MFS transporter [Actinomycetota bacterium]
MKVAAHLRGTLDTGQLRVVVAVAVAAVMVLTLDGSFNFVLDAMVGDLDASSAQTSLIRQVPSVAALLVIFLAGTLGVRLGERRVMLACTVLYAVGGVVVAIAPVFEVVTLGLLLAEVGRSVLIVVGLAFISSEVKDKDGRATAFAAFAAVLPATFLVMPLVAGVILEYSSWRWVAVVWAISGVVGTVALGRLLPRRRDHRSTTGEMLTPALAGLLLAAIVQVITVVPSQGLSGRVWLTVLIGVGAAASLVVALRRLPHPTLSLAPLRNGGLVLLLVVLVLTMFANLWFYMTMGLQYIFGLDSIEVALVTVPAQVLSIVGSGLAGSFIKRRGIAVAGTVLLVGVAIGLFATSLIRLGTPVWVCVLMLAVYSAAAVGASVALTNAVMDLAPDGEEGSASSYRGAALNLGSAIGVAGMTTIVFLAVSGSLEQQSEAAGIDPSTSSVIAADMRDGSTSEDVSALYAVPVAEVEQITEMQTRAFLEGLHAHGLVGGAVTMVAAGMFFVVRRREEIRAGDAVPGALRSDPQA